MTARTVLRASAALVGDDLTTLDDPIVFVEGSTITAIGAASEHRPEDVTIDCRGLTLMPGFIDAHVHIGFARPEDVLQGGVTTVRDLGWPLDRIGPLCEASEAPDFPGPTIIAAGQMLTAPGGYPTKAGWAPPGTGLEVSGPAIAEAAVEKQVAAGAVIVKVALNPPAGPTLPLDTLRAIVDAAHARDLRVTGHVHGLDELHKALDAEMDELAHMLMSSDRIPEETIGRMVAQEMAVVPTLSIRSGLDRRKAIENLHRFAAAGGLIVYGTDLGNAGPKPGIDRREVKAMAAAGLSATDIVRSATVDA
ncbi:MAG: hypothetical protein QOH26_444, partial [Actinomycetota bacterium]|nr:hypothetical protein [Actinomycetota bacterium]